MWRLRLALVIGLTFIATPTLCVLAWLFGYGPGGWRELRSGYMLNDLVLTMLIAGAVNSVAVMTPRTDGQYAGAAVAMAVVYLFALYYWFGMAAGIASV